MKRLLALSFTILCATTALAEDVTHAFQSAISRGSIQRVVVDLPFGSFTIRNGSPNQLALSGIASRDYDSRSEREWAQKVVNDTSVEFYANGAEVVVRRKFGPQAQSFRAQRFTGIDLRLDLPPGVDVEFETSAGEIDLAGSFGDVSADLRAGEIKLTMPRASVRELNASCRVGEVNANLGTEIITREGLFPGRTHFFNPSGRSRVNLHTTAGEINVTLTQ